MNGDGSKRGHSRRDALRAGGAIGLGLAASAAVAKNAAAQDATPTAGGAISMSKQTVTLETAQALIEAAHAHAVEIGVAVAVAVVDEAGVLKAFGRMDGTNYLSAEIAQRKAYTAAIFRNPSHVVSEGAADNPQRIASLATLPNVTLLLGGYPITDGDAIAGGIGVSGAAPEQDMEIAEAALAALGIGGS